MARNSHVVYVLRSTVDQGGYYTGLSTDVAGRIAVHSAGGSTYTRELRLWNLVVSLEFSSESSAETSVLNEPVGRPKAWIDAGICDLYVDFSMDPSRCQTAQTTCSGV
jgi:GIY-YIG catalytic domain